MSENPEIADAVAIIRRLRSNNSLKTKEKRALAGAKLKVAIWACEREGLPVTEGNLVSILGPSSGDVIRVYRERFMSNAPVAPQPVESPALASEPAEEA